MRVWATVFRPLWECIAADVEFLAEFYRRWIGPVVALVVAVPRALWRKFIAFVRAVEDFLYRHRPALIITGLIALFLFVYFFPRIVIFVEAGEAAVKFRRFAGGTRIDRVYGEGIHFIFPWYSMAIYDVRVQEHEHNVELLTTNALRLEFQLSIRYRPEYNMLPVMHQEVGPEYMEKIVIPEVVSVLRTAVGSYTAEEVFTTKRGILDQVFNRAIDNVSQRYILVDQVIIRTIKLPPAVEQAVEQKIEQQHIAEAYEFRLDAEQKEARRKEIEAEGFRTYNQIVAESLSDEILRWKGIEATSEIAKSENSKVIVVGNGDDGLPIILGAGK